jgi:hypothetical protein
VQLDEPLRQREPETGALARLRADVRLLELLEDPLPTSSVTTSTSTRAGSRRSSPPTTRFRRLIVHTDAATPTLTR